ncbi:DUF6402 family protein [Variovorax sp. J2P1-59]|uniref:DUF6402 family protein n=1 Tax=Variovorax flavidus TaxID=3053501 RepID=UPI002575B6CA|nr:DUF6402 family protein [Variovorax sp. J2P1-59]MDM0075181.1 DUF6402 family protein [Variovorax sp. J2P1-59]
MSGESYTEVGRYEFAPNGKVILSKSDTPITYYKTNWLLWTWVACAASDKKGCAALERAALSMNRAPPPLRGQPKPPPPPPKTREQLRLERDQKFVRNLLTAADAVHHWWTKPTPSLLPPRQPKPATAAERPIPPFDIQEIPDVMDRTKRPVSARMMRHWFAGESNYSRTKEDVTHAIDHNGKPFAPSMIDQSIIKLDWVLGFPRAKRKYDELIGNGIFAREAEVLIRAALLRFFRNGLPTTRYRGDSMAESGGNVHLLHPAFQFQRAPVDEGWSDKFALLHKAKYGIAMGPDDLTGALGTFSIYAAIGDFVVDRSHIATVESIYVYVKDSYSFLDPEEGSIPIHVAAALGASQYLGHWNRDGVYLAPLPFQGESPVLRAISKPLVDISKSIYEKGAVMYPVTNKSFRDWRTRHGQGGDFIAYSDVKKVWTRSIKVKL